MAKKPSVGDQIEYGLQEQTTPSTETQNRVINPEIEAQINTWIEQNPERVKTIRDQGLEILVRKEIYRRIKRETAIGREAAIILDRLKSDQALARRVEDKIRNVPEERKERARLSVAKDLIAKDVLDQAVRA